MSATLFSITRVSPTEWQAADRGLVVGEADASPRPDGRVFLSIDTWADAAFEPLAQAVLTSLQGPLHTIVDETDAAQLARWQQLGFTAQRRELSYAVPTDPHLTGLDPAETPSGMTIVPVGQASPAPLHELDQALRAEIAAGPGWATMPAEILPRPAGVTVVDPTRYTVAATGDQYVGLLRLAPVPRRPRLGLLAVRTTHRRRGIARALLAQTLGTLHHSGVPTTSAEVTATNEAAVTLFESIGARHTGTILELTRP